jgi:hypothetical protein
MINMNFPKLFRELHRVEESDYERIRVRGNPAYSGLRRGYEPQINIRREKLEDELINAIEGFIAGEKVKHVYLFSRETGAGKSHTQHILRRYCREKDIPFADIEYDDVRGNLKEAIPYMLELVKGKGMVIFLECDMPPEIYAQLTDIPQCFIIGSGHNPNEELARQKNLFRILDIERDYPLTHDQLYELLKVTMDELRMSDAVVVEDEFLRMIAESAISPGDALNVLGLLLGILAYKAKKGEEYKITDRDVKIWTQRGMPRD